MGFLFCIFLIFLKAKLITYSNLATSSHSLLKMEDSDLPLLGLLRFLTVGRLDWWWHNHLSSRRPHEILADSMAGW
ncbi:hypothetical protein AXF42_Ash004920 [Apostasia shenzhenica]|uniref:Uncharacterized protein n=1 Tax=Apostasia shenzhenica TaxID=1088818 RepID=A0A2I0B801_9ASPA|nr:hypothetical protein AXF42_Ash004920 [Apostasia shenzhenica]